MLSFDFAGKPFAVSLLVAQDSTIAQLQHFHSVPAPGSTQSDLDPLIWLDKLH
jgi:hypothetical protein